MTTGEYICFLSLFLVFNDVKFRYNYDKKKFSELSCANDDHPLKGDSFSFANLSVGETNHGNGGDGASPSAGSCSNSDILDNNVRDLAKELESVAVDWKSLRSVTVCPCSTPFDQFNRKVSEINICFLSIFSVIPH